MAAQTYPTKPIRIIVPFAPGGYNVTGWYAFLAPAGTPHGVLAKLNQEMTRILRSPATKERLLAMGAEPWPTSLKEAQKFIASEVVRWGKVIKGARISAD